MNAMSKHPLDQFFRDIGARRSGECFVLDGFSVDCYLIFDLSEGGKSGTCDIFAAPVPEPPSTPNQILLMVDAEQHHVVNFLIAFGIDRFSKRTQRALGALVWGQHEVITKRHN